MRLPSVLAFPDERRSINETDPPARSLSRRALLAVTGLAVLVVLAGCSANEASDAASVSEYEFDGATATATVIEEGRRAPAPAFSGELMDGTRFESSALAGDVAVINFWGSWCAPCRIETPAFQAVYADVADGGVQFLGVDVKDQRELGASFLSEVGVEYPSLFDPRGEVALAFRGFPANVVPSTILLDREGRVAAVYAGEVREADLRTAVGLLVEESGP